MASDIFSPKSADPVRRENRRRLVKDHEDRIVFALLLDRKVIFPDCEIVDERDRSIGICTPLPLDDHAADPKMFRQNCEVVSMTSDQVDQTSSDENKGFEGVACDAVDQRLYVITERDPMCVPLSASSLLLLFC